MTRTEGLMEYFSLALQSLMRDAQEAAHARAGECEPELPGRIEQCQARKVAMLAAARAAGLLGEGS